MKATAYSFFLGYFVLGLLVGAALVWNISIPKEPISFYGNQDITYVDVSRKQVFTENGTEKISLGSWEELISFVEEITVRETRDLTGLKIIPRFRGHDGINVVIMHGEILGHLETSADGFENFIPWSESDFITYLK